MTSLIRAPRTDNEASIFLCINIENTFKSVQKRDAFHINHNASRVSYNKEICNDLIKVGSTVTEEVTSEHDYKCCNQKVIAKSIPMNNILNKTCKVYILKNDFFRQLFQPYLELSISLRSATCLGWRDCFCTKFCIYKLLSNKQFKFQIA